MKAKLTPKLFLGFIASIFLGAVLQYPAVAGQGALLGLQPSYPLIDFSGTTGQGCNYDATADTLTITGTPGLTVFGPLPTGPITFINGGLVSMTLNISGTGTLTGGSFSVTGNITSPTAYASPLLTGTFVGGDYGLVDISPQLNATDVADFRAVVTGGSMASLFTGSGSDIGVAPFSLESSTYSGNMIADWACGRAKGVIGTVPAHVGKTPFECYGINKVKIEDKSGTTKDSISVEKAGFRLAAGDTVNMTTDAVKISLDGLVFNFPAGSFVQKGSKPDYVFKSASGVKPKVEARLRFDKKEWELKVTDGDVSLIDNSNGVDIVLTINGFESSENVYLTPKGGGKLEYKRNPKLSCKLPTDSNSSQEALPGTNKLSCLASLTVQHSSGTLITKSTAGADLLHPSTVFTDDGTGDMAIIHTSCSRCLRCGDVEGNFTIVEISGVPGDKMSRECGVADASCSLLPP